MNKQLFFGKNIAHNTKANAVDLVDGEIGFYGINAATFLTEKVVAGQTYERVWLAAGTPTLGKPHIGRTIALPVAAQEFEFKKFPYSPFIKKKFIVSIACDSTKNAYDSMILKIADKGGDDLSGQEPGANSYAAVGKFTTDRAIYDKWAEQITERGIATSRVIATATDAGLIVEPQYWDEEIYLGVSFWSEPLGIWCATCETCDATVTQTQDGDSGSGHQWHLINLAMEAGPYIGAEYNIDRNMVNPSAALLEAAKAAGNSDILYIKWKNLDQPKGDVAKPFSVYQEIFTAFPTGTNTDTLESLLASVLNATLKISLAS
jgi:hypothetical protein